MSSRAYRLKHGESPIGGVRRLALGCAEKAIGRLRSASGDEAAAIHDARKELKKLRALLRLIRPELGESVFKEENRCYRDVGRRLAGTRDATVRLETLHALRERRGGGVGDALGADWEAELEQERDDALARAGDGTVEDARGVIEAGTGRIPEWPLATDSWELVGPGLARSYRDGRRALKRVLAQPSHGNVHRWRKRVKDLRYELQILRETWPPPLEATIDQAHELSDLLGDHHDLAVLAEDLGSRHHVGGRDVLESAIADRQEELLAAALEIGRRLYAEKPRAFRLRMQRYWQTWHEA